MSHCSPNDPLPLGGLARIQLSPRNLPIKAESRGFTLIELLVVLAIIALLLTIAVPRYFSNVDRAKENVLKSNLAVVRNSLDKYYGDRGRYPDELQDLVANKYLRSIPVDPITERTDTWVLIAPADPDQGAIYDITSGAPGKTRSGIPYNAL